MNEFSPFAIPNHSSPISMSMRSLKKIGQKLLKSESGHEALMAGWMDRWMDRWTLKQFGRYNIIPCHFFVAGYNNNIDYDVKEITAIWQT